MKKSHKSNLPLLTRSQAHARMKSAIENYRGYTGPGRWQIAPSASVFCYLSFDYLFRLEGSGDNSQSFSEVIPENFRVAFEKFGGFEIAESAGLNIAISEGEYAIFCMDDVDTNDVNIWALIEIKVDPTEITARPVSWPKHMRWRWDLI